MSDDFEGRASRILQDLRPETPFLGRDQPPRSLAERLTQCSTPGLSVSVIDDFQVVWASGFGTRMAGTTDEVTSSTPFQAGSISKPVFALSVMRLVESGKLDLDVDVNGYLTSWQIPAIDGWQPRVTLRQLLSHTAGTTVHGFPGYPASGPWPTIPQILRGDPPANNLPVVVDLLPGTQFRYSGGGTTIAQQVVVDVLGKPFPDVMRELILDPLGMADSTFEQPLPAAIAARAATAHPWNGFQTRGGWHVYPEMAAAGLWTTAGDLARLAVEIMQTLRGEGSKLGLKQDTAAQMVRPQLADQKIGQDFAGLGWFCTGKNNEFQFGHQGQDEGFLAELKVFPALGTGAIVMVNSIQGWVLRNELIKAIGRELRWPVAQTVPTAAVMPSGIDYSGQYRNQDGTTFRIVQVADGLQLQFEQQTPIPLAPASDAEFFTTALNLRVRFERSDAGPPASMTIVQSGKAINLARVMG